MPERLQKYLARAGVASRRHAEELITQGRIAVNNAIVTQLGTKIDPDKDLVTVDGTLVHAPEDKVYYLLYKPAGVVTTMEDPQGRPTVASYLDGIERRVFPVGRLDFDAEGALLMTDDGAIAHALTHPSFEVRRTYLAKVKGVPTAESLERMRAGVRLEDGMAAALEAEVFEAAERNTWIKIVVAEGRPHLIKRLCAAIGHPVVRLFRPAQGGISVHGLKPGEIRPLTHAEVEKLKAVAEGGSMPAEELFLPPRRHGRGVPGIADEDERFEPARPARTLAPRDGAPRRGAARFAGGERGERGGARVGSKGGFRRGGERDADRFGGRDRGERGRPSPGGRHGPARGGERRGDGGRGGRFGGGGRGGGGRLGAEGGARGGTGRFGAGRGGSGRFGASSSDRRGGRPGPGRNGGRGRPRR